MGEGVEFVGEVAVGGTPGLMFGGDAGSVGSADGGGTVGAVVGGEDSCSTLLGGKILKFTSRRDDYQIQIPSRCSSSVYCSLSLSELRRPSRLASFLQAHHVRVSTSFGVCGSLWELNAGINKTKKMLARLP